LLLKLQKNHGIISKNPAYSKKERMMSMFCIHCGSQIADGCRFCTVCGKPQEAASAPVTEEVIPVAAAPVVEEAAPIAAEPVVEEAAPVAAAPVVEEAAPVAAEPVVEEAAPVAAEPVVPPAFSQFSTEAVLEPPVVKKKSKKGLVIGIIAGILVILLGVGGFFGWRYLENGKAYDKAVSFIQQEKYEDAIKLLEDLDFKDSDKKLEEAKQLLDKQTKYADALQKITDNDLQAALDILKTLEYKDSADKVKELENQIKYNDAVALMEEESYEEALELFKALGDYKDSKQKIQELEALIEMENFELVVNGAQLEYELVESDIDAFYSLLTDLEAVAMDGTDLDAVEAAYTQVEDQLDFITSQCSIAMILYYCDLTDEAASQLYLDAVETLTQAENDYNELLREVYLTESPANEILFADWTDKELALLVAYTSEIMELEQRNSEIEVAYQDLQADEELMYDAMVPLYIEMVQNNNRIAQIYGYDNYYTFAYEMVYLRDYSPEEIETMRQYVADYLSPTLENAMTSIMDSMEELSMSKQMKFSTFIMDSYKKQSYVEDYIKTRPAQMRDDMAHMFNGNILMQDKVSGAMEGAFTATITEDHEICFFGPGYSTSNTVIHELGHYYGGRHMFLDDMPLDLAETQSQGNEWLFIRFLQDEMDSDLHAVIADYNLYNTVATITISTIVDDFEQQVYTHPDIANLTGEDLDQIMEDVCQRYGGVEYLSEVATDIQYYWRMVVVEQPVYYISYAVSAVASVDIYTIALQDEAKAISIYQTLIEKVNPDEGFLGNIQAAGVATPFEEKVYKALYDMFA